MCRGRDVETETGRDADRLEVDRAGGAADNDVGPHARTERRFGARALIDTAQRTMVVAGRRREHGPDQPAAHRETHVDPEFANFPCSDSLDHVAAQRPESALDLFGRTEHVSRRRRRCRIPDSLIFTPPRASCTGRRRAPAPIGQIGGIGARGGKRDRDRENALARVFFMHLLLFGS